MRAACAVSADQVARAKPAPDSLLHACELLQLSPQECWYVGDDKRDITAGRAAGMLAIAADWGYLGADGPIESWGADHIARSPQELAEWRSEERRVGKEGVSTCSSRWSPYH